MRTGPAPRRGQGHASSLGSAPGRGGTDIDAFREQVTGDAAALAAAVEESPGSAVSCYDGWTLVDLGVHVGQIHRWVRDVVLTRATARPSGGRETPPEDVADLPAWIVAGAADVVSVLGAAAADDEVWTISRTDRDVAFWRQRMVLETALHRWDADDALGRPPAVPDELALAGVDETLHVYLEQRLGGLDVGGDGQRVGVEPDGATGWTVALHPDGIEVVPGVVGADAVLSASALDLWLLLTCRRQLDDVRVRGDRDAAALAVRAATLVPGPAG
jgi:uncharacterized protein (TIGR03083 family)